MKKFLVGVALAGTMLSPFSAWAGFDANTAQSYLLAHANNPWSTMGLVASKASSVPSDYLKSVSGSSAIEYAAPILAVTALNQDPRTFGHKDYVAELKKYYLDNQLGDVTTVNDDIFGLLALVSSGLTVSDPVVAGAKDFILTHQQSNGGWGFAVSGGTDSNMTAAGITALIASGVSASDNAIQTALSYLKTAQNEDGGFTYDPQSQWGTDSDASSTAWVLWALQAVGANQSDWIKAGHTPVAYLESSQTAGGYFKYQAGSVEDGFSATTTAYAVIALSGQTLPLKIVSGSASTKFAFRIEGQDNTVCAGETAGPTALDIVKNASAQCNFSYHIQSASFGEYLDQINDDQAAGLVGWLYLVNNVSPSVGAADYSLRPGDTVLWYYGDFDWKPSRLSLADLEIASGSVSAAKVEYFEDNAWLPLTEAKVFFGVTSQTTDQTGQCNIEVADGYYQIFAEKDGYIRSNRSLLKVGQPAGSDVSLSVNVQKGKVEGSVVAFEVNPNSVDFGTMKPGQSNSQSLTLTNTGDVNILIQASVQGDGVFVDNLSLDSQAWQNFETSLAAQASRNLPAELRLPSNYSGAAGNKSGSVTIWAMAQ